MDKFNKETRSKIMSKIKSKNTRVEIDFFKKLSHLIYPMGYRYRKHSKNIPGKPDISFPKKKLAIFIDGDFWHGYDFKKLKKRLPQKYWIPKIEKNMKRDKMINRKLKDKGWIVLRFWEHEVEKKPNRCIDTIIKTLKT